MSRRAIENLIALTIPEIQELFLQQMQDVVDRAMLDEMVAAIEAGDAERLFQATGFSVAVLNPIVDRIERMYRESAEIEVGEFPTRIRTPTGSVLFRFDMRNPAIEREVREHSSQLVTRITDDTRQVIRKTLERGQIVGRNPRNTALEIIGRVDPVTKKRIGGVIGLTPHQERWVDSVRRYLTQGDEQYFSLGLRDKRFDKTVERYIKEGKPIPRDTVEKALVSYKNRALKYRANVIARTEAISASSRGRHAAIKQLVTDGTLPTSAIKKWWDATGDYRTRPSHRLLERGTKNDPIGLDEPFVSPVTGARMLHPHDQSLGAPASELVQCRCYEQFDINWIWWQDE